MWSVIAGWLAPTRIARLRGCARCAATSSIRRWPCIGAASSNGLGTGLIVEFRSVVDAVRCAIEFQSGMIERNVGGCRAIDASTFASASILATSVEEADGDLMGDGVNIAARLEGIADPGGVCLSAAAYEQVRDRLAEDFVDLGERSLKNISRPVRVYAQCKRAGEDAASPGRGEDRGRRACRWLCCPSPISAATPRRTISSTA